MKSTPSKAWLKALPYARPAYPDTLGDRLKYLFWRMITPLHPHVRDLLYYIRVLRSEGRQNYLLGKLAPGQSLEHFVEFLLERGFGNHFVALDDDGQLVSMRYAPDFKYQYHIRIFNDGEVRGHYEYTPEYRPFAHFKGTGMEARIEEFWKMLGDKIVPAKRTAHEEYRWSFATMRYKQ